MNRWRFELLAKIIRQQTILDLVDCTLRLLSNLFETDPDENGTTDMIMDDTCLSALATFNSGQLLGFAVKLLDFPAKAAHTLYDLHIVLRHFVCDDVVRALGRQHNPEKFHLVVTRKAFDLDDFAMLFLGFRPFKTIHTLVRLCAARVIDLTIILERTVVDFVQPLNQQQNFLRSVPTVHQNCPKRQLFLINAVEQHVLHMVQLGLAVPFRVIDAVVNDPELIDLRIDVDTGDNANALDDFMNIATVLFSNQFDVSGKVLVNHCVIKNQETIGRLNHLPFDTLPHQPGSNFVASQITVRGIVTEFLSMLCKVRQRVIDLTNQQILTVVQSCNRSLSCSHAGTLPAFHAFVHRFA